MDVRVFSGVCVILLGALFPCSGACNVTLFAQREPLNFTSPNYPRNYRNNDYCYWTIYPHTSGYTVVLDMVYSNIATSTFTCQDSLTLNMKNNANGRTDSTRKICGKTRRNVAAPQGQYFYVVFVTDNSITESGFLIRYYETREKSGCDRRLEATTASKTFTSPGYPNAYFPRQTCDWTITTEQQNQIVFLETIDALFQNPSATGICYGDYVNVYNGQTSSDLLGTFCGTDKPVFLSSATSMRVRFHSDGANNYKGFQMRYTAIPATMCNATLTAAPYPLKIVSPAKRENCVWIIQSSPSQRQVSITILASDADESAHGSCSDDNGALLVYNGRSTRQTAFLGRWCESGPERQYSSTVNSLTVIGHSGGQRDVTISYQEIHSVCGSPTLTASSVYGSYLTSPGYPANYPDGLNCVWVIYGPNGTQIKAEVLDVAFEASPLCERDYLVFREGTSSNSEVIKQMCVPVTGDIFSSGNQMYITFHSDMSVTHKGFRLKYSAVKAGSVCGNIRLIASTWRRYLTSPGYPIPYHNGLECQWTVVGPIGMGIKVHILFLDMETSETCTRDYLLFSDGVANATLAKMCRFRSTDIVSTSNYMVIDFHTDSSVTGRGFSLQYFTVNADAIPNRNCGKRNLSADTYLERYLTSPGYPSPYANNLNCEWTISAPFGKRIRVAIVTIQMITTPGCVHDYLLLSDGASSNAVQLNKLCAATLKYIFSSGTSMTITFHTDTSGVSSGFSVKYKAGVYSTTPRGCGHHIDITHLDFGQIESPNYPLNYPRNVDCTWTVSTDNKGYVIRSSVVSFNTEEDPSCIYDYVQIYDGPDSTAVSLGRWCGLKGPAIKSSGAMVCVVFRSDHSGSRSGFVLSFSASKPSYADSYSPNVGGIVGGTLGAIVFALMLVCCCLWCNRKKSSTNAQPQRNMMVTMVNHSSQDTIPNSVYSISLSNQPPSVAELIVPTAPPAYDDVVKNDPPPYCEVMAQLDFQPVVTSYPSDAFVNRGVDNPAFSSTEV
ncbi:cubilin-like [Haliotis rufescens]|uniref:cubilin-like n=1 Tax=Haliotis rufescens TaxID=6454 RepID=UPI00201ED16E|nr:cubilin-like [Haliotis rufescens]